MRTRKILIGLGAASILAASAAPYGGASAQSYGMTGGYGPDYSQDDGSGYGPMHGDRSDDGRSRAYGPAYRHMHDWRGGYGPGMMYGYGYGRGMMGW